MENILLYGELNKRNDISDKTYEIINFVSEILEVIDFNVSMILVTRDNTLPNLTNLKIVNNLYLIRNDNIHNKPFSLCSKALQDIKSNNNIKWILFPPTYDATQIALGYSAKNNHYFLKGITEWETHADSKSLIFRKSIHGNNYDYLYDVSSENDFVGVIFAGIFKNFKGKKSIIPQVTYLDTYNIANELQVIEEINPSPGDVDLTESEIIIGGGRGVEKEKFNLIEKLSLILGGNYGGTRVAVDNKYIDSERQIGRTGKIINPYLYITFGISGSTHHTMGVKDSKYIISVNTDRNAPIFSMSDLKICADVNDVLPILCDRFAEKIGSNVGNAS